MVFKDKLSFLMGLTETKNRQLAKAITVDPSLVSRFRSGNRTPPDNAEYIKSIVDNRKKIMMHDIEMKYTGEHDPMTGLYNRAKYASMLKEVYIKLEKVVILYFDINNLKYVNDTYGHDMGDELIIRAVESLRGAITENMDAYRLGGDEFMVVLPNGDSTDAEAFIENWKQNLKTINSLPSVAECKMAYGYASGNGKVFSEILNIADKNMYDNKVNSKTQESKQHLQNFFP